MLHGETYVGGGESLRRLACPFVKLVTPGARLIPLPAPPKSGRFPPLWGHVINAGVNMREVSNSATRLKRVLFALRLDPAGKFGSIEEQALTLARSFREQDGLFLPLFLRPLDPESATQYAREGLDVEALDLARFEPGTLRRMLGIIRRHRIEIVHWNFYHPIFNVYPWALAALAPWVDHYFTDHISRPATDRLPDGRSRLKSRLKRIAASRYRRIFCISDFVLNRVREWGGPRAERLRYFVNTERFQPDPSARRELRAALGIGEEFVTVAVAYLIKAKGVDTAVMALARLPENVLLWVVGHGPEQSNLEALVRNLGMERRVRFFGSMRNVEPFLQAADCAVCASTWAEAVGLVNLEALACGLPVVASKVGGIPEFIEDGRNGFLVAPGGHEELATPIGRLCHDRELRDRMSREARSTALRRHSAESLVAEHLAYYRAAASQTGSGQIAGRKKRSRFAKACSIDPPAREDAVGFQPEMD
jgi:glycosyltransferase involved in cell wall biosynthesis